MLVKMTKQVFDSFEDTELFLACFDPFIPIIRGKNTSVKEEIYQQLTRGQQALFMFNVFYNHASKSLVEFYWWSAYYWAQPKAWAAIKEGLKYFKADRMLSLMDEVEFLLSNKNYPRSLEGFPVTYNDLENDLNLHTSVSQLNSRFLEISRTTLKTIGESIRKHPTEYLSFKD